MYLILYSEHYTSIDSGNLESAIEDSFFPGKTQ